MIFLFCLSDDHYVAVEQVWMGDDVSQEVRIHE